MMKRTARFIIASTIAYFAFSNAQKGNSKDKSKDSTNDDQITKLFNKFKSYYSKNYNKVEEKLRFENFKFNIVNHLPQVLEENDIINTKLNPFLDFTAQEFYDKFLKNDENKDFLSNLVVPIEEKQARYLEEDPGYPDSFNHVSEGNVGPVENESNNNCSLSWAFSLKGNIEGLYKLAYGPLYSLSAMQLAECTIIPGTNCSSGRYSGIGYYYNYGLQSTSTYDFMKNIRNQCYYNPNNVVVPGGSTVRNFLQIPTNELSLKRELYNRGPISVSFVGQWLAIYNGGIYDANTSPFGCGQGYYYGLLVGYGKEQINNETVDYWLIKTSLPTIGDNGYVKLRRGSNQCGISNAAITVEY